MSKDSDQTETAPRKFRLGPLGNLNQVTKGLAKTIRAMADGTLDSQVGARICSGLGIMRMCLETQKLEQLEVRMGEISRLLGARTEPQESIEEELTAKEAEVEKIEDDIVVPADASDKDAAVSETPPALNVLAFDCSARSKPWRPVHQRPARDMRRPTWKKWERDPARP